MKISSLLLTLAFALAAPFAGAAQGVAEPGKPSLEELRANIARWRTMPQAERDRIRQAYRSFRSFRPEQASAVQSNFQKFRNMPAERRRELTKKFRDLPPQDREAFAQKLREFQKMGPDRRKTAFKFAELAQRLTPEQKRQLKQAASHEEARQQMSRWMREHVMRDYLQDLPAGEREAFRSLPREEQKGRLQRYWRERVMRGPPR